MVNVKTAHATLHQGAVESNMTNGQKFEEQIARLTRIEGRMEEIAQTGPGGEAFKKRPLIEAKQVEVPVLS